MLALFTAYLTKTSVIANFVFWFIVGEVLHYVAGTQTAFLILIELNPTCE